MPIFVDPNTGERFSNDAEDADAKASEYGLLPLDTYEKRQRSGGLADTLTTVPETAVATVAETGAAVGRALGADVQGADIAPFAFTEKAKERREVNPTAAAIGAAIPDVALAASVPGAGLAATAARAAAGGLLAEGGETAVTGDQFSISDAALYGLTAGVIDGVGNAAMGKAMRAMGHGADALEASVNRARKSALADAVAEPDPLLKAAKAAGNADDLYAYHQTTLDDAVSSLEDRITAAPDKVFSQERLRRTVLDNPVAQSESFMGLGTQLHQAAEVTGNAALKETAELLESAAAGSGAKMYGALRQARQQLADAMAEAEAKAATVGAPDIEEQYLVAAARKRLRTVADNTGREDVANLAGDLPVWTSEMNALPAAAQKRINQIAGSAELEDVMSWVQDRGSLRKALGKEAIPTPSPLTQDVLTAMDDSLGNEALWGRAAKAHNTLKDVQGVTNQSWTVNDMAGRQSLLDRLAQAKRVADTAGDEAMLKAIGRAEKAIAEADAVSGAKVMSKAAAEKADLAEELAEQLIKKGVPKAAGKLGGAAAGFVVGGPAGAFLGNIAGDLAEPFVEQMARNNKPKIANVIRSAMRAGSKVTGKQAQSLGDLATGLGTAAAERAAKSLRSLQGRMAKDNGRNFALRGALGSQLAASADELPPTDLADPIADEAQQRADAARQQLQYLKDQSRVTVQTTARAVASPAQNARPVPRMPGVTSSAGVASFVGSSGNLRTAYESKRKALQKLQEDPMSLIDEMADSLGSVADANPDLHRELVAQTYKVAAFLQGKLPTTIGASLTRPDGTPPSPLAVRQFALYYSAATDPSSVLADLTHNRAQKEQVETLKELWPDTYDRLKMDILHQMSEGRPTFAQRQRMDLLFDFGASLDTALSPRLVAELDAYNAEQAQGGPGATAAAPKMPTRQTNPTVKGASPFNSLSLGANKAA